MYTLVCTVVQSTRENWNLIMKWQHVISFCLTGFAWCESESCIFGWVNSACRSALAEFPIQFLNITSPTERAFSVAGPSKSQETAGTLFFSWKRACMCLILNESLCVWQSWILFAHCTFGFLRRFLLLFAALFSSHKLFLTRILQIILAHSSLHLAYYMITQFGRRLG